MHVYVIGTQPINVSYKKKWLKKEILCVLYYNIIAVFVFSFSFFFLYEISYYGIVNTPYYRFIFYRYIVY